MSTKYKEDLNALCFSFSLETVRLLQNLKQISLYKPIADQLLRAATSIGANITEAKSASSRKDFTHYYEIALKSANETKYWLQLTQRAYAQDTKIVFLLLEKLEKIIRIITSSVMSLKNKRF